MGLTEGSCKVFLTGMYRKLGMPGGTLRLLTIWAMTHEHVIPAYSGNHDRSNLMKRLFAFLVLGTALAAQTPVGPRIPASGTWDNRPGSAATGQDAHSTHP